MVVFVEGVEFDWESDAYFFVLEILNLVKVVKLVKMLIDGM